jgi:hypothetical protein
MVDSFGPFTKAATKEHALESERRVGKAKAVCGAVVIAGVHDERTVYATRYRARCTSPRRDETMSPSTLRAGWVSERERTKRPSPTG